jgi:uncharacterized protein (TIGR00251 family)
VGALVVPVWVKPGSSRDRVGGRWGDEEPARLIVRVRARAVDGAANRAVEALMAQTWGVPSRDVAIVSGAGSRGKVVRITGEEAQLQARWRALLDEAGTP